MKIVLIYQYVLFEKHLLPVRCAMIAENSLINAKRSFILLSPRLLQQSLSTFSISLETVEQKSSHFYFRILMTQPKQKKNQMIQSTMFLWQMILI